MLLRRTRHLASILPLLVLVGSLFALDMKLHELQPELVAAQKQRYMAQQEAIARARQNQPAPVVGSTISPPADSDEERRADRKTQIAIDRQMLTWTKVIAGTGIFSVVATGLILLFQTIYTRRAANAANLNAEAVAAAQRAWISLDALHIEQPIVFGEGDLVVAASFKNSGRTTAKIVAANITMRSCTQDANGVISDLTDIPDDPVYDPLPVVVPPPILVAGEASTMRVAVDDFAHMDRWRLGAGSGVSDAQWIYGYIHYTDSLTPKVIRSYGWARKYDLELSERDGFSFRFAHVNKPKYTYAD